MKSPILTLTALLGISLQAGAAPIPAELPDPDGKPGNPGKPVQVYLLAGQSNMVGMGLIAGAKNLYNGVYLSADPAAPTGPLEIYKVGKYLVAPLTLYGADGKPADQPLVEGELEVPQAGIYRPHAGSAAVTINGKAGGEIPLEAGTRYAFKLTGFEGKPPRLWMRKMDLLGYGDLDSVAKRDGKFPWLTDGEGNWTVRNDVYFQEARVAKEGKGSPLTATSNGKTIGPELGFGHVMGTFHDEQVLLIKTAMGNRALGFDFRPPSSGRTDPDNKWESLEYTLMVEGVRKTLDNIDKVVPGYKGQGYEMAGFAWFQGHKDSFSEALIEEYEKNLVNLIKDVRKEFKAPNMPAVVATVGFGGHRMQEKFLRIHAAQLAVGDPKKHPELAGTVASVDIRDFWREVDESPKNEDYHYNRNAETYVLIGDALGRAMVGLKGGSAEALPLAPRPKQVAAAAAGERTEAEKVAAQKALAPIVLEGIAAEYLADPRYGKALLQEASGERPQRASQFLRGATYGLLNCYHAAGIHDYDWHPFGPDFDQAEWDFFSFAPPEKLPVEKGNRYRKVTVPAGMKTWPAPDFDAAQAGWKKGRQPFGQLDGKMAALSESCTAPFCRCGESPKTLWEHEVLLVRGTFDVPPLKAGHRYRIVVGGAAHVNSGEGYAVYVNGKLLAESKSGVAMRQGGQERGAHIYADFRDEFKGGKVTIAATSFLRYNHPRRGVQPPRGHFSLCMEEAKIPPVAGEHP